MHEYTCVYCKMLFTRKLDRRQPPKYCSRDCSNKATGKNEAKTCPTCLVSFKSYKRKQKFCSIDCFGKQYSKESCHFWRGGVSTKNELARKSTSYRRWRQKVFDRDNYTCQSCLRVGGRLVADHIKPFAYYKELRYDITNGRTLCEACHYQTDTYGAKAMKFREIAGK